uniref:tRNA modification GTPase TrmE n=1 Tax=Haemonchus contortus TaxID=6289 RepID=A0A7I4XS06_HAECO
MHGQPSTSTFHSSPSSSSRFSSWVKRLAELKTCPWYWGDLSWKNAEKLLLLCEDGSFLVRDSHSDNHLFTVSYKYSGKVYHSRVEISGQHIHLGAPFSMERPESIADLLKHAIQVSYGRERDILMYRRGDEADSSEIRLQYPLSRLSLLPRLQYLCRLKIRLAVRDDQLSSLPLPPNLLAYVADPKFLVPNIRECLRVLELRRKHSVVMDCIGNGIYNKY